MVHRGARQVIYVKNLNQIIESADSELQNNMIGGEEYDDYDDYDYGPQQGRGK